MIFTTDTVRRLSFIFLFFLYAELSAQLNPFSLSYFSDFDTLQSVSFSVVGDLMVHSTQFRYAQIDSTHFNFNPVFKYVKKYLSSADFTMGNLETVTAGKEIGWKGYPKFNTPDDFVTALKNAGFDVLFTANNHALDQGELGVERTIKTIKKNGMENVGTYPKGNRNYLILYKNYIKIAILAYTYGTNGFSLPDSSRYAINVIRRKKLRKDLLNVRKEENPDLTIVYFHFGDEYNREPSDFQLDYVNYAFRYGADIILGSHPHVIQPVVFWKNKKNFTGRFVAYSLGNFISNQTWRYSDCGVIMNFIITKNFKKDSLYLKKINFLPTWVYKGLDSVGKNSYYILPATLVFKDSLPAFITPEDKKRFIESINDTKEKINEKGASIPLTDISVR